MSYTFNPLSGKFDYFEKLTNPIQFKGNISVNTEFPLIADVQTGWFYTVSASVTDDAGVIYTNTGQSFIDGDEIAWNGTNWSLLGNNSQDLHLDQTTPQTVDNGVPIFDDGIKVGSSGQTIVPDANYLRFTGRGFQFDTYPQVIADYNPSSSEFSFNVPTTDTIAFQGYGAVNNARTEIRSNVISLYGNTLIGTTSDDGVNKLQVAGEFSMQNGKFISTTDGTGDFLSLINPNYYQLNFKEYSSGSDEWHVGPYWLGTTDPNNYKAFSFYSSATNDNVLIVNSNGNGLTNSAQNWRIGGNGVGMFGTATDDGVGKLQVNGQIDATNIITGGLTTDPTGQGYQNVFYGNNGFDVHVSDATGNVRYDVRSGTADGNFVSYTLGEGGGAGDFTQLLRYSKATGGVGGKFLFFNWDGDIQLSTGYDSDYSPDLVINHTSKNIMLGTSSDDGVNKLQVEGTATVTSLTETTPTLLKLDQTTPQTFSGGTVTGTGLLKVTSGELGLDTTSYALAKNAPATKTIVLDGDLRGLYAVSATKKLPYSEAGSGITITSIVVQCSNADPTTELNANIMKCDAQGTGAFPGANPTLIRAIDTTTGNFTWTGSDAVATGKELYLLLDADPTDLSIMWTITIQYTVN
jgi:hypothetical protein